MQSNATRASDTAPGSRVKALERIRPAFAVTHPRWEPYAGRPHVRDPSEVAVSKGEGEKFTVQKPRTVGSLPVCPSVKLVGKPGAGNRHARFDERGWETERCRMAQATAPILDSTISGVNLKADMATLRLEAQKDGKLPVTYQNCEDA
jgi:hypothetical protein